MLDPEFEAIKKEFQRVDALFSYLLPLMRIGVVLAYITCVLSLTQGFYKPPCYRQIFLTLCSTLILISIPVLILQHKIQPDDWKMNLALFGVNFVLYGTLFFIEWGG